MKLIIGLGNPGTKYENTRHNVGFMVLDDYQKKVGLTFKYESRFNAETAMHRLGTEKILCVKPTTYMNLSGEAVIKIMNYYDVSIDDILVFVDDINLDVGKLRLRSTGGHGGHNGLRNIIGITKDENFKRVRIGVGLNTSMPLDKFVLGQFSKDDLIDIDIAVQKSCDIIEMFIKDIPFSDIMTKFNTQT